MNILTTALSNPHTSGAALAFAVVKVLARIARIWFPHYDTNIATTADALESLAVVYFGWAAGDASKSVSKADADTTFMRKPGAPPETPTKP